MPPKGYKFRDAFSLWCQIKKNIARLALSGWPNNSGFNLKQANDENQFPAFYIACEFS